MKVKDVMTADPACCISETTLQEVAQMMIDHDCGEIPVVDNKETKRPIGVITDRDIVCRAFAKGESTRSNCGRLHDHTLRNRDSRDDGRGVRLAHGRQKDSPGAGS